MPQRFFEPLPHTYARRLLHRDPVRGYNAIVMTWGPGQGTALHDHGGIWCVEGVVAGEMSVVQFERIDPPEVSPQDPEQSAPGNGIGLFPADSPERRFCFAPRGRVHALAGASGALIPPFEYHTLNNALPDHVSVTLHVYGGEMKLCHIFEPTADGSFRRVEKHLVLND